ncbi:MAG TPA: hypothetical protein VLE70_17895 [Anaerolineae bacterium]|jgi:hypothetical protein|nr:hypothetical protein [Anaerolineae bacterium]
MKDDGWILVIDFPVHAKVVFNGTAGGGESQSAGGKWQAAEGKSPEVEERQGRQLTVIGSGVLHGILAW